MKAGDNGEEIGPFGLDKSPAFNAIVKEILRMYSGVTTTTYRRVIKNVKIGGYKFRKGDTLLLPLSFWHILDKVYENPKKFDVNRFSKDNDRNRDSFDFLSFSTGKRNCIGQYLADFFIKSVVSKMYKNFEIEKDEDFDPIMVMGLVHTVSESKIKLKCK